MYSLSKVHNHGFYLCNLAAKVTSQMRYLTMQGFKTDHYNLHSDIVRYIVFIESRLYDVWTFFCTYSSLSGYLTDQWFARDDHSKDYLGTIIYVLYYLNFTIKQSVAHKHNLLTAIVAPSY